MCSKSLLSFCLATLLSPVVAAQSNAGHEEFSWLLAYRDKGENALAWDKRFSPFLHQYLPDSPLPSWSNEPVSKAAETFFGGVPGYIEVRHNRYFAASGCPAHACVERALLWVDTASGSVVLVATGDETYNGSKATRDQYHIASAKLFIATKATMTSIRLPDELRGSIIRWLHLEGVLNLESITLLTPSGPQQVTTDQLCWTGACSSIRWD